MAELKINITGDSRQLDKAIKKSFSSLNSLKSFASKITIDIRAGRTINTTNNNLAKTRKLLQDIKKLSTQNISILGGGSAVAFQKEGEALAKIRLETEAYINQAARLRAELASLRLENAKNKVEVKAAAGSYMEAKKQLSELGKTIRNSAGGFNSTNPAIQLQIKRYQELSAKIKQFDVNLKGATTSVNRQRLAFSELQSVAASYLGYTAIVIAGQALIRNNAKVSDSLADVRRTSGLTSIEADNLANSLKQINTRSSIQELLGISVIGGQLGIAKDQLGGFTEAVDQLAVSLSGELQGGAEGIAKSLGVLDNVFGVTVSNAGDVKAAYNQIGSAILGLGQSGLATGDFLADFGERVGGIAKQAGLSLPVVLAYGAVLQENGVSAEVAGTSFKRLLSALSSNSGKFFAVAQMADANLTLKQFNAIVNTDTQKALELFFAGLRKGGSSTIAFNSILKTLKISGAGVSQSVAAIANNIPALNRHIQDATKDFNEATKAGEQFEIKNNTLGASLDKLGNSITNITTNPNSNLGQFFKAIVDDITDAINAVDDFTRKVRDIQYQSAINTFRRTGGRQTGNAFISTSEAAAEIKRRNQQAYADEIKGRGVSRGQIIASEAKNQIDLTRKLAGERERLSTITQRLNYSEAFIRDPNNKGASYEAQINRVKQLRKEYSEQTFVVGELQRQLEKLYPKTTPRSNKSTPDGFNPGAKKGRSLESSANSFAKKLIDLSNESEKSTLNEYESELKSITDKYEAARREADLFFKKSRSVNVNGQNLNKSGVIGLINENEAREVNALIVKDAQQTQEEITQIYANAGVKFKQTLESETAAVEERYRKEIQAAQDNYPKVIALTQAKFQELQNLNDKYVNDFNEKQADLYRKIQDLTEKDFTDNVSLSRRTTDVINRQMDERIKKVSEYYEILKLAYSATPGAATGLNVLQAINTGSIAQKGNEAKNPALKIFNEDLKRGIQNFANDFIQSLQNISSIRDKRADIEASYEQQIAAATSDNQRRILEGLKRIELQANSTFSSIATSIFSSLSRNLGDVFGKQLIDKIGVSTKAASDKLGFDLSAAIAGANLVGGLVSGLTKKTSGTGQGIGGAITGAATGAGVAIATGAALGAPAGPIGIAIGAGIGLLVGAVGGILGAKKEREKQRLLAEQQLEEQRKQTELLRKSALAYSSQIIGQMSNQGIVTGVDRNATGDIVFRIQGRDLVATVDGQRARQNRGNN